jgi:RNA polymerase sigma factor (sigma-70 family)
MKANEKTRRTLLARLKAGPSQVDWEQFYDQYSSIIISFCLRQGLDHASASDVLQETMVLFMRKLPEFEYQPERGRFRNWLLTLVAGKVRDSQRRVRRSRSVSWDEAQTRSDIAPLPALGGMPAEDNVDEAWMLATIEEALRRIATDGKTSARTVAAFEAYVIQGEPAGEVARRYSIRENTVYQIRNRMLDRLQEEVTSLRQPDRPSKGAIQ